jgi:SAM-dependent methyltransferase
MLCGLDEYFESYGDPGVHRVMIGDHARTDAFRRAIEACVKPGDVVLDVGAGSGILSLFAARAGALRVYAVEPAPIGAVIADLARANGLADRVRVRRCPVEELELHEDVDVLMSEWMGYFGLAECMFESVLAARDAFLAPRGLMLPSRFRLHLFPCEHERLHREHGVGLWERPVYDLDFSPMLEHDLTELLTTSPNIPPEAALGPAQLLCEVDCKTGDVVEFWFDGSAELVFERDGTLHALGGYFEVDLGPDVTLSCAPSAPSTHWRQSWFPLRPFAVRRGDKLAVRMRAVRPASGDSRLPVYLLEGELTRGPGDTHAFFYRHAGSFE